MTLEELKRQNDDGQNEEPEASPLVEGEALGQESAEETKTEEVNLGEGEAESEEAEAVEAWMQSDEQTSQDNDTVPLSKHINLRKRLKEDVREKDSEIEALKQEIEALKTAQPVTASTGKPKREDFYEQDDPDEAYADALLEWKLNEQQKVAKGMEEHYQRAQALLDNHNIDTSVYQKAERGFRESIESALPQMGDTLTEALISQVGSGSEKLVMYVGNSNERKQALQAAFATDGSGLSAMRLIGRWEAEIQAPAKRTSKAPAPAASANGEQGNQPGNERSLKKRYQEAAKSGNVQKRFDIRQEAKKAGFNPDNW